MNETASTHPARAGPQGAAVVSAAFNDPDCAKLIAVIVRRRRDLGISCYELAALAGLSRSTVCRMESGKLMPGINVLLRYCRVCGLCLALQQERTAPQESVA